MMGSRRGLKRRRRATRRRAAAGAPLRDLPAELIARILSHLDRIGDLVATNAAARLFRGAPLESALRERARARGHEAALPTALPTGASTWTEELFARERIVALADAHAHVVSAGRDYALAFTASVDADGALYVCGETDPSLSAGGEAAVLAHPTWHLGGAHRLRAVAAGGTHLLALCEAGGVYARGGNERSQLGLGDTCARERLSRVASHGEMGHVVGVAAGRNHSLAHTAAGAAFSCGCNWDGQLGHGDRRLRCTPELIDALAGVRVGGVATGDEHTLLLSACGAVYACGRSVRGETDHGNAKRLLSPLVVYSAPRARAVHVSAGAGHSLVVDAHGGVHAFGDGRRGQLGQGDREPRDAPARITALDRRPPVVLASAGHHTSAVVSADGSVHAFGWNLGGRLGLGHRKETVLLPKRVQGLAHARVLECSLGRSHSLYVTAVGDVYACGERTRALGLGREAGQARRGAYAQVPLRADGLTPRRRD